MKKIIIPISIIIILLTVSILGISLIVNNNDTELVQNTVEEISTVEETTSVEETTEEPTTVYEDLTSNDKFIMNVDRGESIGTVVETNPEVTESAENAVADSSVALTNEYYTKDDNGNISVSEDFYSSLQAYSFFEGATVTEVNDYLTEEGTFLIDFIEYEDTEGFDMFAGALGENGDKLHEEEVVTTKPAEKPAQQTQQPAKQEPVQQPVQQPVQPSQQEPVVQEPAPTLTPEEAAAVAENDAWVKEQMEKSAAIDYSDPNLHSGIDHGDYTSY